MKRNVTHENSQFGKHPPQTDLLKEGTLREILTIVVVAEE
jgi:hypothetical protein